MKKRITILIITFIMTFSLVLASSCADNNSDPADTVDKNSGEGISDTDQTQSDTAFEGDDLGEFDFKGSEFRMLTPDPQIMNWANPVIDVSEQTGITLDDSIYQRNRTIEDRFNMKFVEEYGEWDIGTGILRTIVNSGDSTYNIVTMMDRFALSCLQENLIIPYTDLPHIDMSKPYWGNELLKYSSIGGKNYFAFGDFSLFSYDNVSALLFNHSIIESYNLDSPYQLVLDKKWTLDKFSEMCVAVTQDLNGDGKMKADDQYGYLSMPKQVLPSIWIAGGALSIAKNSQDFPVLNLNDEKIMTLIDKAFQITWDTGVWYNNSIQADTDMTLENMFSTNKGLFHDSTFNKILRMREMDKDFGIVPYPMADESQKTYLSRVSGALFSVIPVITDDLEMHGVILEALASESRKTVIPVYYEVSLKSKYSRDEESQEMLDIIFSNRVYDLGDSFWCDDIRDNFIKDMFVNDDRDLASNTAKRQKTLEKKIEKTINAVISAGE